MEVREKIHPSEDSKYIQQHLANERTFLAWIRTILSVVGIGIVGTSLHFELNRDLSRPADFLIKIVGFSSLLFGLITLIYSVCSYMVKRKGINDGTFRSVSGYVVLTGVFLAVLLVILCVSFYLTYGLAIR
jgi:putative membrane protein